MNKKTTWLLVSTAVAGIALVLLIRQGRHRKWEKERARIIAKARKKHYGEFVL